MSSVFVCRPWRCMGIWMDYFSPKNGIDTVFKLYWTELLDFLCCRILMKILEYFLHGCDVYTMRHRMQNLQLLPLMRFSFRDVSATTSNYTAFLIHRVPYTSFSSLLNFFWVLIDFTVKLPTPSTLLLMLFSNVFEIWCFKLLVLLTLFGVKWQLTFTHCDHYAFWLCFLDLIL